MAKMCAFFTDEEEKSIIEEISNYKIEALQDFKQLLGLKSFDSETIRETIFAGYKYARGVNPDITIKEYMDDYFFASDKSRLVFNGASEMSTFQKLSDVIVTLKKINSRYDYLTLSMVKHIQDTLKEIPYLLARFIKTGNNSYKMLIRNVAFEENSENTSPQDKTVEMINNELNKNSKLASLDHTTHTYTVYTYREATKDFGWVKISRSVTSLDRKDTIPSNPSVATLLGTMFDGIARHFFQNISAYKKGKSLDKEALKTAIKAMGFSSDVMTDVAINNTVNSLIKAAEVLDAQFGEGWKGISSFNNGDLPPVFGYLNVGKERVLTAGTLDMLIVDTAGDIHLVDFKTIIGYNSVREAANNERYQRQLQYYRDLIMYMNRELGSKIKSVNLLVFSRNHVNKTLENKAELEEYIDENGHLKKLPDSNGEKAATFTGFKFGIENDETSKTEKEVGGLYKLEFDNNKEIQRKNWESEQVSRRLLAREEVRRGDFAASKLKARRFLRASGHKDTEVIEIATNIAKAVIALGRSVFTSPDDSLYRQLTNTPKEDFDTRPKDLNQSEFIANHINQLYTLVVMDGKNKSISRDSIPNIMSENKGVFDYIKYLGLPTLRYLEGIVVSPDSSKTAYVDPYNDELEEDDPVYIEQKDYQSWQFEHNLRSFRSSLSVDIKRVLSLLPTGREDDSGITDYCNANTVTNLLLQHISKISSLSQMIAVIKGIGNSSSFSNIARNALVKQLEEDSIFASKFYQAFRKAQIKYGDVETYLDSSGHLQARVKILNVGGESKKLLSNVKVVLPKALLARIDHIEKVKLQNQTLPKPKGFESLIAAIDKVLEEGDDSSHIDRIEKTINKQDRTLGQTFWGYVEEAVGDAASKLNPEVISPEVIYALRSTFSGGAPVYENIIGGELLNYYIDKRFPKGVEGPFDEISKFIKSVNTLAKDEDASIQEVISELLNNDNKAYTVTGIEGNLSFIDACTEYLKRLGFEIEPEKLYLSLSFDREAKSYNTTVLKALIENMTRINNLESTFFEDQEALKAAVTKYKNNIFACKEVIHGKSLNALYNPMKKLSELLGAGAISSIETTAYFDGKNFYAYVNPSFLNTLVNKLNGKDTSTSPQEYINKLYYKSRFFKDGSISRNHFLKAIFSSPDVIDHKVQLGYNNVQYRNMGSLTYQMAMINEFFSNEESMPIEGVERPLGWFRVHTMSNKPAAEFIRMPIYRTEEIKNNLIFDLFMQELWRIKTVIRRAGLDDISPIESFDLFFDERDKSKLSKELLAKLKPDDDGKYSTLSIEDVETLIKFGNGAKFFNLDFINKLDSLDGYNSAYKEIILNFITNYINNGTPSNDAIEQCTEAIQAGFDIAMQKRFEKQLQDWKKLGMFDYDIYISGNTVEVRFDCLPSSLGKYNLYNFSKFNLIEFLKKASPELYSKFTAEKVNFYSLLNDEEISNTIHDLIDAKINDALSRPTTQSEEEAADKRIRFALEDYYYNDWYNSTQLAQVTSIDYAYYLNFDAFQKRNAQQHSPALKFNKEATYKGKRVSDGFHRHIVIKDFNKKQFKSSIIGALRATFEKELEKIEKDTKYGGTDSPRYKAYKGMVDWILEQYEKKVEVTDGQSYTTPTAYRKKMIMSGEWGDAREEAYQRIKSGDLSHIYDLKEIFQPLKPFIYGHTVEDAGLVSTINKETVNENIIVGRQVKNSEYLLCIADAIIQKDDPKAADFNKLRAIYEFAEESYDNNTIGAGETKGIDTIAFASCVKVGLSGIIDLNNCNTEDEIKQVLSDACYQKDDAGNFILDDATKRRVYNTEYVHVNDYDNCGIQQNNPAHFQDHQQLLGSQSRVLLYCDVEQATVWDEKANAFVTLSKELTRERIREYNEAIADNINIAAKELLRDLGYNSKYLTAQDRKSILSKILKENIQENEKYAYDIIEAIELDDNGNFVLPLYEPSISIRIQELLASLVKNRINKQMITGGPLVQVCGWGVSKELNIRYRDSKNNLLLTKSQFEKQNPGESYEKYLKDNTYSLAYLEAYAPCPNEEIEKLLTVTDSTGRTRLLTPDEAVQKGKISREDMDKLTELIGYRIPTEAKYSMMPIKIVGFLPRYSGEGIMLPYEVTMLTGSDFDIDKLYVIRKAFNIKTNTISYLDISNAAKIARENYKKAEYKKWGKTRIITDTNTTVTQLLSIVAEDKTVQSILSRSLNEGDTDKLEKFDDKNNEEYKLAKELFLEALNQQRSYSLDSSRLSKKDKNNNIIFQHQWDVLTDPNCMDKVFNPGNFEKPKKTARKVTLLKALRESANADKSLFDYSKLSSKSREELEALLEEYETDDHNLNYVSSQLYYHKQNMAAAKLIGIFANHNVSHAMLQLQNIYYSPNKEKGFGLTDFSIGGYQIVKGMKLDAVKALNGVDYISKNIAEFLAASVDAAKDPVLNFLNLNLATANVAMTLIRLGVDTDTVGLFLAQDCIIEVADAFAKASDTNGYANAETIVKDKLEKLFRAQSNSSNYWNDLAAKANNISTNSNLFSKQDLVNNILNRSDNMDIDLLVLFGHLLSVSKDLNEMVFETKFNSINNSVGPQIANTFKNRERVKRFEKAQLDEKEKAHFDINLDENGKYNSIYLKGKAPSSIIDNNPILKAFYNRTYGELNSQGVVSDGLEHILINDYFPHYGSTYINLISQLMDLSKSSYLDEKKFNSIINEYFFYQVSKTLNLNMADRLRLFEAFPENFKYLAREEQGHPEIKYLYDLFVANRYAGEDSDEKGMVLLDLADVNLAPEDVAYAHAAINTLVSSNDPAEKSFVRDFLLYNLYRSAYNFNGKSAFHLLTAEAYSSIQEYVDALYKIYDERNDFDGNSAIEYNFIIQYMLHHTNDWATVPEIRPNAKSGIKLDLKLDDTSKRLRVTAVAKREGVKGEEVSLKNSYIGAKGEVYTVIPVIKYKDKIYVLENPNTVNSSSTSVSYKEIKSLGIPGTLYEYEGNTDYSNIESIVSITNTGESTRLGQSYGKTTEDMNYLDSDINVELTAYTLAKDRKKYSSELRLVRSLQAAFGNSVASVIFSEIEIKKGLKNKNFC